MIRFSLKPAANRRLQLALEAGRGEVVVADSEGKCSLLPQALWAGLAARLTGRTRLRGPGDVAGPGAPSVDLVASVTESSPGSRPLGWGLFH